MKVELLEITPKTLVVKGIRKCWKSEDLSDSDYLNDILGEKDKALIKRVIEHGHTSTLEHSLMTFDISGVSRALLQELSRHRIGTSPSVESTRYTLGKIVKGEEDIKNCLVSTGNEYIDKLNYEHMVKLKALINTFDIPNDIAKYGIVEAYTFSEQITFNFRSFRHFLELRTSKKALWEIRDLANMMLTNVPDEYMIFFDDVIH